MASTFTVKPGISSKLLESGFISPNSKITGFTTDELTNIESGDYDDDYSIEDDERFEEEELTPELRTPSPSRGKSTKTNQTPKRSSPSRKSAPTKRTPSPSGSRSGNKNV